MDLKQLEISYDQVEDRLILTIYTGNFLEFKLLLTRKMTLQLWQILKALVTSKSSPKDKEATSKNVALQIEEEHTKKRAEAKKYAQKLTKPPAGSTPLLIQEIICTPDKKLLFKDNQGQSLTLSPELSVMIALIQLIEKMNQFAEWHLVVNE